MDMTINYNEQMLNYYPEVIKSIREFQKLIETESLQVDDMHKELTKILDNAYISTADEDRIAMWEKTLGIVPLPQTTLSDRRETILARIYNPEKLNTQSIEDIVSIFTGGKTESYFKDGVINVLISPPADNKQYKFENVEQELRKKVPAHLGLNVSVSYYTWDEIFSKNKTWNDINANYSDWNDVLYHP